MTENFIANMTVYVTESHLGRDGSRTTLFAQQVHDVRGELVARVLVLVQLLMVDLADLRELGAVVRVLDRVICLGHSALSRGARGTKTNTCNNLLPG